MGLGVGVMLGVGVRVRVRVGVRVGLGLRLRPRLGLVKAAHHTLQRAALRCVCHQRPAHHGVTAPRAAPRYPGRLAGHPAAPGA